MSRLQSVSSKRRLESRVEGDIASDDFSLKTDAFIVIKSVSSEFLLEDDASELPSDMYIYSLEFLHITKYQNL